MGFTFAAIPVFNDVADANLAGNQPLTDAVIQMLSANAKFAAVRPEVLFAGFYGHGDTVILPVSPVDGYTYLRSEVSYVALIYSNRSRAGVYTPGQLTPPDQSSSQPQNGLYNMPGCWDINDLTGVVNLRTSYYSGGGAEVVTTDGILKVYAVCQRGSISIAD